MSILLYSYTILAFILNICTLFVSEAPGTRKKLIHNSIISLWSAIAFPESYIYSVNWSKEA